MAAVMQQQLHRAPLPRCRKANFLSIHAGLGSTAFVGLRHNTLQCATRSQTQSVCRSRQLQLDVHAKRRGVWGNSSSKSSRDKSFRLKFNQIDVSLAEDQLWRLAIPFAALFGLAVFIGPLVVGITVSAVAVGAAFSAGALAFTTLLLPLIVLSGIGGLMSFGVVAALGAALVVPKMIFSALSLAVVGGGLALGWGGVNWLLTQQSSGGSNTSDTVIDIQDGSSSSSREGVDYGSSVKAAEADKDVRRVASELRQFDELLARAEERRRVEEWQQQRKERL
ncbi:hypothetical protein COO60DRAFT_1536551 [Scenedesmus sp. NREL 46B-D3]|nr:hypothetical protein COO60DRAFT_1536551 [Scenedesmus sp. NREL 46B-D3]